MRSKPSSEPTAAYRQRRRTRSFSYGVRHRAAATTTHAATAGTTTTATGDLPSDLEMRDVIKGITGFAFESFGRAAERGVCS